MRHRTSVLSAALSSLILLGAGTTVSAATIDVTYSVDGKFSVAAGTTPGLQFALSNDDHTISSNGVVLSYTGVTSATYSVTDDGTPTDFITGLLGSFHLSLPSTSTGLADFDKDDIGFTYSITQSSPSGTGSLAATVNGKIKFRSAPNNSLVIEYVGAGEDGLVSVTVPTTNGVTYTTGNLRFENTSKEANYSVDGTLEYTATGPGTTVPTPAAVWSGASLLGLLGAAKLKKRQSDQA